MQNNNFKILVRRINALVDSTLPPQCQMTSRGEIIVVDDSRRVSYRVGEYFEVNGLEYVCVPGYYQSGPVLLSLRNGSLHFSDSVDLVFSEFLKKCTAFGIIKLNAFVKANIFKSAASLAICLFGLVAMFSNGAELARATVAFAPNIADEDLIVKNKQFLIHKSLLEIWNSAKPRGQANAVAEKDSLKQEAIVAVSEARSLVESEEEKPVKKAAKIAKATLKKAEVEHKVQCTGGTKEVKMTEDERLIAQKFSAQVDVDQGKICR